MPKERQFEYKWVIAALGFLMIFVGLGFFSSTRSLFIAPVTDALEIPRSAFSLTDSFRYIATSVTNLFFGFLIVRFGAKKLVAAGFLCLFGAALCFSFAESIVLFYVGGVLMGIGFSWTTTTIVSYVVNHWFTEKKGTIMGAVLAANGLGGAVATQIVTPIIYEQGNPFGYRNAYRLLALIFLIVGIVMLIFFEDKPKTPIARTVSDKKKRGQDWIGIEFSVALRNRYFYGAAVCIFFTGMILQGMFGVAGAHMKDVGLDPAYVATVLSVNSLCMTLFKFLTGVMYDKWGLRVTVTVCSVTAICMTAILALLDASPFGLILAMVYGIFAALAMPLETIIVPLYASDLFGQKSFDHILGLFVSINTAGFALASPILNFCFDTFGSYSPALIACSIAMIAVVFLLQFVITAAHKMQKQVLESVQ